MTNARRSAGLRRVSTATYGLVAASVTGAAVVTGVVAHQGVHHAVTSTPTAQTDDGASTGSAPASQSASNDDALGSVTPQSPAAQSTVQTPAQQQPAQQTPVQVLPGAPAPVVGAVQKPAHHHAVTSGS